jgi:hypothetical protein
VCAAVDAGADALALVANFPDYEDPKELAAYSGGSGLDSSAGAEAVISHLVTGDIGVPRSHAPALPPLDADPAVARTLGAPPTMCIQSRIKKSFCQFY